MAYPQEDTALGGGRGDCASFASGGGGSNLYYRLVVPQASIARITATPTEPTEDALVRVLSDCRAAQAEAGARGVTGAPATVCIRNEAEIDRAWFIAVGRYSGEAQQLDIRFGVSVEITPVHLGCGG